MRKYWKTASAVSAVALAAACMTAAHAQVAEAEPAADEGGLAEIVVTAQKRTESLSRTAAAVSVVGQQTLDSIGARNFNEAVSTIPNVSAGALGGTIAIRGLGSNVLGSGNGTVAYHVDGIFQQTQNQSQGTLFDIARVEVLRGPQGTLYGRNATAGVVNVITNNANTDKFEAFGDVGYGNWNRLRIRGAVNVPISDAFAVRLTGTYEKGDDWKRLPNGDRPKGPDVLNLRLAWRAQPTDRITWDARLTYTHDNTRPGVAVPTYLYDKNTGQFIASSNPRDLATLPPGTGTTGLGFLGATGVFPSQYRGLTFDEANTRNSRSVAFRSNLNFELSDNLSLTYLLGYAHDKSLPGVIASLQPYQVSYAGPSKTNSWSHELNLNYQSERVKAILGLYSFSNNSDRLNQFTRLFNPSIDANTRLISYSTPLLEVADVSGGPTVATTRAIFGQATFDVTDRFRVTGGVRYNWDRVSFSAGTDSRCPFGSSSNGLNPNEAVIGPAAALLGLGGFVGMPLCTAALTTTVPGFPQGPFGPSVVIPTGLGFPATSFFLNRFTPGGEKGFEKFSWKGTLEYDLGPDTMVYATVATGYKAGGVGDTQEVGDARFFLPETNINYEAGIRTKLFNNTLSLNLTAFWTDYKDLQISTTTENKPGQLVSINAGRSRSRGIELEYAWAPTRADRLTGYVSYLDATFRDFLTADTLTGKISQFAGNRLPAAPEFSTRISYSHIFDLGSAGTLTPTASFYYQSKSYSAFSNVLPSLIPAYTRTDLIVRYETANKRFSVEGFVNNLEDNLVQSSYFPEFNVSNTYFLPPRSYGFRVGFRY